MELLASIWTLLLFIWQSFERKNIEVSFVKMLIIFEMPRNISEV